MSTGCLEWRGLYPRSQLPLLSQARLLDLHALDPAESMKQPHLLRHPPHTNSSPNAGTLLARRLRRRANGEPALGQCFVFTGMQLPATQIVPSAQYWKQLLVKLHTSSGMAVCSHREWKSKISFHIISKMSILPTIIAALNYMYAL